MKDEKNSLVGIPLKERSQDDIRKIFAGEEEEVVNQFLALHAYACKHHLGLSRLGQRTNIPPGVLSECFNHVYKGDYYKLAERIDKFFYRLEQKEKYGDLRQFVETRLTRTLWTVFEKTRAIRRIQIIQSPEQLGKSRAATEYTAANNSGRTVYIELPGGTRNGCGDFIWTLAEQLDIPYSVKMREKRIRIKHGLEACDLFIIDQAHQIFSWADSSVRDFCDYLITDIYRAGSCGIVLIATNSDMLDNLARFRRRAGYNVGQLLGRMRNEVIKIDPVEDVVEEDVAAIMTNYYKPGKDAVHLLHSLAQREQLGHFGLVFDILNESWARTKAKKRDLNDEVVIATAREIVEELKGRKQLYE